MHITPHRGRGLSLATTTRHFLRLSGLLLLSAHLLADSAPLDPDDRQAAVQQLSIAWQARRSEIATADIHYRQLRSTIEETTLTPDKVRELVEQANLGEHPERVSELALQLRGRPSAIDPPWAVSRIVYDGFRSRYEQGVHRQVRSPDLDLIYDGDNEQVSVFPRQKSRRRYAQLSDFRWVGSERIDLEAFDITRPAPGQIHIRSRAGDCLASLEADTGVRMHSQGFRPDSGEMFYECWEQGFVQYSGGVLFPSCNIHVTYQQGRPIQFWIHLVDEARFNIDLPEQEFQMVAHEGDVVLDYRTGVKDVYRLPASTTDLERDLPLPQSPLQTPAVTDPADRPSSDYLRWIIGANGVLLIIGGIFLWRRSHTLYAAEMQKIIEDTRVE